MNVKFSEGNSKMGQIPSTSFPAIVTCRRGAPCIASCYGRRMENFRKEAHNNYTNNLDVYLSNPEQYWTEVKAKLKVSRFFRFNVSGDIPDSNFYKELVDVAREFVHCDILIFTKKYEIVNDFVDEHGLDFIPTNLHTLFSAWPGLKMINPYNFPEVHIRFKDGYCEAPSQNVKQCGGNCTDCAITDDGCWTIGRNEYLIIDYH